jgi:hypothetical protein
MFSYIFVPRFTSYCIEFYAFLYITSKIFFLSSPPFHFLFHPRCFLVHLIILSCLGLSSLLRVSLSFPHSFLHKLPHSFAPFLSSSSFSFPFSFKFSFPRYIPAPLLFLSSLFLLFLWFLRHLIYSTRTYCFYC